MEKVDVWSLQHDHAYYYQVQLQMRVCKVSYCHFIVWSKSGQINQLIPFNEDFVQSIKNEITHFFKYAILPELLGKWYTRKPVPNYNGPFNILSYISFSQASSRTGHHHKLHHRLTSSSQTSGSYFHRLPRLWNGLPSFDLSLSPTTNCMKVKKFLWNHFLNSYNVDHPCTYHLSCPCSKCSHSPKTPNFSSF